MRIVLATQLICLISLNCPAQKSITIFDPEQNRNCTTLKTGDKMFLDAMGENKYLPSKVYGIADDYFVVLNKKGRKFILDTLNLKSAFSFKKNNIKSKILNIYPVFMMAALINIYGARIYSGNIDGKFIVTSPVVIGVALLPWIIPRKKFKVDGTQYKIRIE